MVPREKAAPFRLMYLGDMNQRDVPVIMVTALKRLIERGHDLVLDVVGGVKFVGPAAQARGMSQQDPILRGRVSFYGRVSDEEVRHRFSAAHALLFTRRAGRTAQAAFPTRLPEFLMTRRPVISTAIGDIPEYLPDGQAAVLVKPEDMDDLVAGIERLLAMPDEGRALGEAGCEACTRYFDYRVRSVEIASFMEAVVSGKYCSTPR